jgi:uncharacterized glyoxalase superfamily protein PhnB
MERVARPHAGQTQRAAVIPNRSAPAAAIVPILVYEDVGKALEFLTRAFGFKERLRAEHGGAITHAQMDIGEGSIMMGKQGGQFRAPSGETVSQYAHVHVDDVDRHFASAKSAGAIILKEPADMPFGVRQYTAKDIGGHWWTFSQNVRDVDPAEWGARVAPQK